MKSPSTRPPTNDGSAPASAEFTDSPGVTRTQFVRRGLAASLALGAAGTFPTGALAATKSRKPPKAPHLPAGFTGTFKSRYITANGLRQHVVIGGDGPPLLLVHGWPQNWYQYRLVMPALAQNFSVIAVDQRGRGQTSKPPPGPSGNGYDTGTLADDMAALMDALGYQSFSVACHDTGMDIAYA